MVNIGAWCKDTCHTHSHSSAAQLFAVCLLDYLFRYYCCYLRCSSVINYYSKFTSVQNKHNVCRAADFPVRTSHRCLLHSHGLKIQSETSNKTKIVSWTLLGGIQYTKPKLIEVVYWMLSPMTVVTVVTIMISVSIIRNSKLNVKFLLYISEFYPRFSVNSDICRRNVLELVKLHWSHHALQCWHSNWSI
jgi:hypothetical protein